MKKKRKTVGTVMKKREIRQFISVTIFYIIVLLVALFLALTFFLSRILIKGDSISSVEGYSAQTIISGSMVPTLDVYDVIIVKREDNYQLGDIITFYVPDENNNMVCFTHRIVSVGEGFYLTQGDANQEWDDWTVYRQNVVGAVQYKIPKIGKFVLAMSNVPLWVYKVAIIAVFSILIIIIIVDTIKEATREFTKKELQMLELSEYKKANFKMKRYILKLRMKRFIQTKIMKRQI